MKLLKEQWKVKPISLQISTLLVKRFHYAKSASKNAVALHGLFMSCDEYCVMPYGVCWWIPLPSQNAAEFYHEDWRNVLALSRMVLTPDAPENAASFMLSRSIKMLPQRYHTLATYADSWQGHTGRVYLACNWIYQGLTEAKAVWRNQSGAMVSYRKGVKTLTKADMLAKEYTFEGYYPKHRYVYYRHKASTVRQLSLFDLEILQS